MVTLAYLLKVQDSEVIVSLSAESAHQRAELLFEGPQVAVAEIQEWLEWQYGAYGHLAFEGMSTTAVDLAAALARPKAALYQPKRFSGGELVQQVPNPSPPGALT